MHWADKTAHEIARRKKSVYICASGITPSGIIHFGNFREIISVNMVVRALKDLGCSVRFLYFWDDYDVFRKIPTSVPSVYKKYLRYPLDHIPAPDCSDISYALYQERRLERCLPVLGIDPEYIHQSKRYQSSYYAEYIKLVLEKRDEIRKILNTFRLQELGKDWWPIIVYSAFTEKDTTTIKKWDGLWQLSYMCNETQKMDTIDIRKTGRIKLVWRVDWPMRWACEKIDFEPAGKDHHSDGGSFSTAQILVKDIFHTDVPVTFQYDFVGIKGKGGKMSSSQGNVIALDEVMGVYQPELIRYLFARTRPNSEFFVSFDLDVIKNYEDYDRCERITFGKQSATQQRREKEQRIYELAQVGPIPSQIPLQIPFRHLCSVVQITQGNLDAALSKLIDPKLHTQVMYNRARGAWEWVRNYAPETFRFALRTHNEPFPCLDDVQQKAIETLTKMFTDSVVDFEESFLKTCFQTTIDCVHIIPRQLYEACYQILIGKQVGPRLIPFLSFLGKDDVLALFREILKK